MTILFKYSAGAKNCVCLKNDNNEFEFKLNFSLPIKFELKKNNFN